MERELLFKLYLLSFLQGKIKSVNEQANKSENLEPSMEYDAHTCKLFQRGKKWAHSKIYNTSQVIMITLSVQN